MLAFVEDAEWTQDDEQSFASLTCSGLVTMHNDAMKAGVASIVKKIGSGAKRHDLGNGDTDGDVLEMISPGIRSIFMSLLDDNRGSLILAQYIVGDTSIVGRADLIKQISTQAPRSNALNKILKEWNASIVETDMADNDESMVEEAEHDKVVEVAT